MAFSSCWCQDSTSKVLVDLGHKNPKGVYFAEAIDSKVKIKIKRNGKFIEYYSHFETGKSKLLGKWEMNNDTIILTYRNKKEPVRKYLFSHICLKGIESNKCVFTRTEKYYF